MLFNFAIILTVVFRTIKKLRICSSLTINNSLKNRRQNLLRFIFFNSRSSINDVTQFMYNILPSISFHYHIFTALHFTFHRVSLSVQRGLVISTYWASLSVGRIKKWPRPRPCYQYSVQITMYVGINFVPIKNQKRGVSLSVLYR